jgi:hypothetical protein
MKRNPGDAMHLAIEQIDGLRMGALTAIDGLWFLALESKLGFDAALEIDLEVWKNYGVVLMKRIARAAGMDLNKGAAKDLRTVRFLLETLCLIDGTKAHIEMTDESSLAYLTESCPWWDNLKKSGRDSHPCEMIDNVIFRHWLAALDVSLTMEITHSRPRGDGYCRFSITQARTPDAG